MESKSAAGKTLHGDDSDGIMAEVKCSPIESLAAGQKDKKKKKLERKPSNKGEHLKESLTPAEEASFNGEKKKKKKSVGQSVDEDLFSIGQDDSVVGSFDAVSGRRTMNKKMRELAANVKVIDVSQRRKTNAVSIGLDALLEDDFGTIIGESIE